MLDKEGEAVPEKVVRTFLEGNTSHSIEETLVTLLKFSWESTVGVKGTGSHVDSHSDGGRKDCSHQESRHLTIIAVLKATSN